LVAVLPPPEWVGGVDHACARDQIFALVKLGARIYGFDVTAAVIDVRTRLAATAFEQAAWLARIFGFTRDAWGFVTIE
jgi:uncharacterized alpha-E superfamily protein